MFKECQEHPCKCPYQTAALSELLELPQYVARIFFASLQPNLQVQHGRLPAPAFIPDAEKLVAIAHGLAEKAADQPELQDDLLQLLAFGAAGELGPMAAMFGGIIGQEVRLPCSIHLWLLFALLLQAQLVCCLAACNRAQHLQQTLKALSSFCR